MRKPRPSSRRRLGRVEMLEGRRMLATDLAQIAGVVMNDFENDGLGNVVAVSQEVELFADDGDGVFEPNNDTSLGTETTNSLGQYFFNGLEAGNYFVRINPTAGTQTLSGANVSALINFSAGEAMGSTNLTIDDFATVQSLPAATLGSSTSGVVDAGSIEGGEQDLFAQVTAGAGNLNVQSGFINTDGRSVLSMSPAAGMNGRMIATWDGDDNDALSLAQGLGLDISDGGVNSAFAMNVATDKAAGTLIVRAYSGAGNFSTATIELDNVDGGADNGTADDIDTDGIIDGTASEQLSILFTSFVTGGGSGVDFSNVTALQLEIDFTGVGENGLDVEVEMLGVVGYTTKTANFTVLNEMSLGDLVWLDVDNDGVFDAGETGVADVAVTLFEDSNGDDSIVGETQVGTATTDSNGAYLFTDLLPGDYIVRVDASNFTGSGALLGRTTSTGNNVSGVAPDPDSPSANGTDKGTAQVDGSVRSLAVTLVGNAEPTNDGDSDANTNRTLDFGFFPSFDLTISKTDNDGGVTLNPGDAVTYTITATNAGPAAATGVTVTDTLPDGLTFVSSSTTPATNTAVGNATQLTYNLGALASGASQTITIVATIDAGFVGTLTNTATIAAPNESNILTNTATASTTVSIPLGSINGRVVVDVNGNDVRDSGDLPIQGVVLMLFNANDAVVATAVTNSAGYYEFTGLLPGVYRVVQSQPVAFADSNQTTGSSGAVTSGVNTITAITVDAGNNIPVGPDNDFLEGLPLVGKRSFFWSSGLFNTSV